MKITELYLKNFGKFHEKHFYIRDGVQIIYGENEFGKSTIHAFVRAMLFGLERGRGRAAGKDAFSRYEPWENPGSYAGVMRFCCGGRAFRLERSFGRLERRVSLVCEDDGEELSVEHGDLDMLLGGLTAASFDSTVSIGQLQASPGQELSEALKNYAANYYETGGGEIDLNSALQTLRDRRKETERCLREAEADREGERSRLIQECRYLERDMESLRSEFEDKRRQAAEAERTGSRRAQEKPEKETGAVSKEGQRGASVPPGRLLAAGAGGVAAGALGLVWSQFLSGMTGFSGAAPMALIGGLILAVGIIFLAAGVRSYVKERREEERSDDGRAAGEENTRKGEREEEADDSRDILQEENGNSELDRLRWEMDRIRSEWKEKQVRRDNLKEQADEIEPGAEEKRLEFRKKALQLAEEKMKGAAESLGRQTSGRLNRRASEIFSELTGGRYRGVSVGEKMEITVWDGERNIRADRLSRGTLEQIYFSVRMAAAELLLEEPMPVLLDDTFAFYDEKRLESVLKWLSSQKRQVIIFTCHKREQEILDKVSRNSVSIW
mgnify:FL=1